MADGRAYVYGIMIDGVLRYIGKGTGRRMRDHARLAKKAIATGTLGPTRFIRRLSAAIENGSVVTEFKFADGLSDHDAFSLEAKLIGQFEKGQLWNIQPGGSGFSSPIAKKAHEKLSLSPEKIKERSLSASQTLKRRFQEMPEERERLSKIQVEAWDRLGARDNRRSEMSRYRRIGGVMEAVLSSLPGTLDEIAERNPSRDRRALIKSIHKLRKTQEIEKIGGKLNGVYCLPENVKEKP